MPVTAKRSSNSEFRNHVTNVENMCSVPSLSTALEFVCDHQQALAMEELANGFVFIVLRKPRRAIPTSKFQLSTSCPGLSMENVGVD